MRRSALAFVLALPATVLLGGCDMLGIESAEKIAASREADGKAIGSACRHAGRAIEDCFAIYKKADRSAVFAGWRDMNDYMRENKIEAVAPVVTPPVARKAEGRAESKGEAATTSEAGETVVQVERKPAKATAKSPEGDAPH